MNRPTSGRQDEPCDDGRNVQPAMLPAGLVAARSPPDRALRHLPERRRQPLEQALARFRRRDAARRAVEQSDAESRLQPSQGFAERRSGNAALAGGRTKAAVACNRCKGVEIGSGRSCIVQNSEQVVWLVGDYRTLPSEVNIASTQAAAEASSKEKRDAYGVAREFRPKVSASGLADGNVGHVRSVDRAESIATIHAALDAGITLLEPATFTHGHNEILIGEALKDAIADQVQLAVKFGALRDRPAHGSVYDARRTCTQLSRLYAAAPRCRIDRRLSPLPSRSERAHRGDDRWRCRHA